MLSSRKPKRSAHCPCIDFLLTPCAHPLRCAVGGGAPLDTTINKDRAEEMSQWRGQHPQAQRWPLGGPLHRGLHSQHLHPRHGGDEALRRRHHRQSHQPDHVAHKNSRRGTDDAIRPSPALLRAFGSAGDPLCPPVSTCFFPRLGHGLGQAPRRRRNDHAVIKE